MGEQLDHLESGGIVSSNGPQDGMLLRCREELAIVKGKMTSFEQRAFLGGRGLTFLRREKYILEFLWE